MSSKRRYDNNIILCYSCTHYPFQHKKAIPFLRDVVREFQPDRVVSLGDDLDQYMFSRFVKSPSALSATVEMKKAKECIREVSEFIPKQDVMKSNHNDRLYSKASVNGIPREYIKPYKEIINAPDGWKWRDDLTLTVDKTRERIFFSHDKGKDAISIAKTYGINTVMGHHHNQMSIQFLSTPIEYLFAVQTGCLISDEGPPFEYNKKGVYRPVKGCVIIIDGVPEILKLC